MIKVYPQRLSWERMVG